ncbi:DUF2306 domain-containing protein [Croceitalea rosinachiae]|uniref:DUF2306 domain-containing protein n=1 Tax=Croceitalea rosinachiae TaxID=3075596 RepID=A0ABU3AFC3_9FLAO|nr:DUF2306 domain-containing protein [Croceitalea sp. F388]MDT0608252.1 DUF2306 domain-containing protein [Croceitalea sp. F388]
MEIDNWIHSPVGGIHFITSVIGLFTGAYILLTRKGTKIHKSIGYVFSISLLLVNVSALFIYDFNNGKPSVFHYLIIVSLFFLFFGILPMLKKNKTKKSLNKHIIGLNGAAIGLWAAGATEYFIRELAHDLNKNELIIYSFLISIPFALAITISITYNLKKLHKNK